jgi:hypothetical protein
MTVVAPFDDESPLTKCLVVLVVGLLHAAFYLVVSDNQRIPLKTDDPEAILRVQFIGSQHRPTVRATGRSSQRRMLLTAHARPSVVPNKPLSVAQGSGLPSRRIQATAQTTLPFSGSDLNLEWNEPVDSHPDYRPGLTTDRVPPSMQKRAPNRFRMRKQISGKDVVEGASQLLGLWPPGYTTDPCPTIKRNIGELMTDTRAAARELLDQELQKQQSYCP